MTLFAEFMRETFDCDALSFYLHARDVAQRTFGLQLAVVKTRVIDPEMHNNRLDPMLEPLVKEHPVLGDPNILAVLLPHASCLKLLKLLMPPATPERVPEHCLRKLQESAPRKKPLFVLEVRRGSVTEPV